MDILEKINHIEETFKRLDESGVQRIKDLAKTHKSAEIYYHQDTDGVTSAIGIKKYLETFGIKVKDAHMINYGGMEYSVPKPKPGRLNVMVDFAHGKPIMHIHTDHHDGQVGMAKTASTNFVTTPSNLAFISQTMSPRDIFPTKDVEIISTVDTADFAKFDLHPDDIMRSAFKVDKKVSVEKNRRMMGLVVNKLLLSYKNKPGFLDTLVMRSKPSLVNMYIQIKKLAKEKGYKPPEELEKDTEIYVNRQASKVKVGKASDVKGLKNGESMMVGSTIVQYGGGFMTKGGYDRYTPFKLHPTADYYTVAWPMGLIQLSKNPFVSKKNKHDLGKIMMKVLNKQKSKLNKDVSLDYLKWAFEQKATKDSIGFTLNDVIALFEKKAKGLKGSKWWKEMLSDIASKPYKQLSAKQKAQLKKVTIPLWDIIIAGSGGHHDISNVSGLNFYGKGYIDIMKAMQTDIAKEMANKRLE